MRWSYLNQQYNLIANGFSLIDSQQLNHDTLLNIKLVYMKNKYKPTRVFEQKIPIRLKSCRVNICIYTNSSFASRIRTRAYITYVCACARARMTELVSALIGQKIAENISQNRAKDR